VERALRSAQLARHADGVRGRRTLVAKRLTRRELDVAELIARGRTNREIAEALVITEGTVEVHVRHVLSKLDFRSRSQVVTWIALQDQSHRNPEAHGDVIRHSGAGRQRCSTRR
jgi:DNA-binding NarL/FixJ family response regulator